ncbi:hypothetical protein DFQ30_010475 [Apophysomyces sp. BC1015]|nr:hypothetical protein DFQ30_010475 [Apophysomyces sp. BC1015]
MQQPIEQRAAPIARARMHDQAGRLVKHDQCVVFVHDRQRHWLRRERQIFWQQLGYQLYGRPQRHRLARARRCAVQRHPSGFDPRLQAAARKRGKQSRDDLVQPLARQGRRYRRDMLIRAVRACAWAIIVRIDAGADPVI